MIASLFSRRSRRRLPALAARSPRLAERLNRMLERERARADRSGHDLSLVLLGLDGRPRKGIGVDDLLAIIEQRCRITDDAGLFDKRSVFVLLPDTGSDGARRFAESVGGVMKRRGTKTSFAVYTYAPRLLSNRASKNDDDQHGPGDGDGKPLDRARPPVARRIHGDRRAEPAISVAAQAPERTPRDLDDAMVRLLPMWKRAMDVTVAGAMLLTLWPVMMAIGLAIRLESPGPAVFRQQRAGLGGRPFEILKFRTMRDGAEHERDNLLHINEQDGPAFKIKDDPRVTRIGALLRKTSLDELPQLVNVFFGEMTLVGPRPLPCHESDQCVPWQRRRLLVTPGLTCIWQISGRSTVDFDRWVRMDLAYQKRYTLWHDLRILAATVPAVLTRRGAH